MYIYQIELSNICSLQCEYCPHPAQVRRKGFMSADTFRKCVALYKLCNNKEPLCLHNFGEVLLHPQLPDFIAFARSEGVKVRFFTNGVNTKKQPFPRSVWKALAESGLEEVHFSSHALALSEFRLIVDGLVRINKTFDPNTSRMGTWAGQVHISRIGRNQEEPATGPCMFESQCAFVVLWDGRVSACCLDVEGRREQLSVDDLLRSRSYEFKQIALCTNCSSMRERESM